MAIYVFLFIAGVAMGVVGMDIYMKLKKPDSDYGGMLIVDKQNEDRAEVYFQAVKDPETFTDGEWLRLKVVVVDK